MLNKRSNPRKNRCPERHQQQRHTAARNKAWKKERICSSCVAQCAQRIFMKRSLWSCFFLFSFLCVLNVYFFFCFNCCSSFIHSFTLTQHDTINTHCTCFVGNSTAQYCVATSPGRRLAVYQRFNNADQTQPARWVVCLQTNTDCCSFGNILYTEIEW